MADLIDRQAAIEWFTQKEIELAEKFRPSIKMSFANSIARALAKLPAVDAVQVVRCGTPCRWLYDEPDDYCCMNHKGLAQITPDSFCSYGRRVEENVD